MKRYYSHGKLLLTGEYLVLDGALALAVPTKFGQNLEVEENCSGEIHWTSLNKNGEVWFEDTFKIQNNEILKSIQSDNSISNRLLQVLKSAKQLNPSFLNPQKGYKFSTQLEFPKNWGLGTSSTLINNLAQNANIDPYKLLELTFGGSGYDIACADTNGPITYKIDFDVIHNKNQKVNRRNINPVVFNPSFKKHLYFVYLNKKQDSRAGINQYRNNKDNISKAIQQIDAITKAMVACQSLTDFQKLIERHEEIISKIIKLKPIKSELFSDFIGSIKSLGAWGGDFILVASDQNPKDYFIQKGFPTILDYDQMILS